MHSLALPKSRDYAYLAWAAALRTLETSSVPAEEEAAGDLAEEETSGEGAEEPSAAAAC